MKLSTIKSITKSRKKCYDITVENNHNFFCNNFLIHNCDYRGDVGVILINLGSVDKKISINDKIAQIIFENYNEAKFEETTTLPPTDRGSGGFGSTDKKLGFDPNPTPKVNSDSKIFNKPSLIDLYKKSGGVEVKEKYTEEVKKQTQEI